jgi:HD-like signal output (HDOD) protein
MPTTTPMRTDARPLTPMQRIREGLREDTGLPALGQSVATVSRMADGDSDTVDQLAQTILSDVSLTQRLLRCANSPLYRTRDAAQVTTVSRALVLLGFDQIRSLALSMMLVDRLVPADRAGPIMRDFAQALGAATVARCTLQRCWPSCAEEGAIAGMFRSIGRLVASLYVPEATAAVRAEVAAGTAESQAARKLIGRTYEDITQEVVGSWGLPQRTEQALKACPARPIAPRLSIDWVLLASAFGDECAVLNRRHGPEGHEQTAAALTRRFGEALGLDAEAIMEILQQAQRETMVLAQAIGLEASLHDAPEPEAAGGGAVTSATSARAAMADPEGERRLQASLSKIEAALTGSQDIHRVVQIATEGLRSALGARNMVYFARDDAASAFRPRAAAGCAIAALRGRIAMPVQYAPDLFHAALARGADLHIADIATESVRKRLPDWLLPCFPGVLGFVLLPVMIDGRPMGFFYADRDQPEAPPPTPDQVEAIRLLRNQVVLALGMEFGGTR